MTKKGRIEYQFKTYGGITIVFIEIKKELGNLTERLGFIAQVIAECDGMIQNISIWIWINIQQHVHG